jgi:hypothetical protein
MACSRATFIPSIPAAKSFGSDSLIFRKVSGPVMEMGLSLSSLITCKYLRENKPKKDNYIKAGFYAGKARLSNYVKTLEGTLYPGNKIHSKHVCQLLNLLKDKELYRLLLPEGTPFERENGISKSSSKFQPDEYP